jgi:trigger factor
MTTFERKEDGLNLSLICTIPAADYAPAVKKELLTAQKNAVIKGFRPGKAPMALINKKYGAGLNYEVLTTQLDKDLNAYMKESAMVYVGQPILVDSTFSAKTGTTDDVVFTYEIGLVPPYRLQGADKSFVTTLYEVDVTDEMLDKEISNLCLRYGQRGDADTTDNSSIIKAKLIELNDDDTPKENGIVNENATFYIERMEDDLQTQFVDKSIADSIIIEHVFDLEKGIEPDRLKSWVLNVDTDTDIGLRFEAIITDIKTMQSATLDEALLKLAFGDDTDILNESILRDRYTQSIKTEFSNSGISIMLSDIYKNINEVNKFPLPELFIRKWLKINNEKLTDEEIDENWDNILQDTRFSILRNDIITSQNIKVEWGELEASFKQEIASYLGNYGNKRMLDQLLEYTMKDQKRVQERYENIQTNKMLFAISQQVTVNTEIISQEEFNAKIAENNAKTKSPEVLEEA